MPVLTVRVGDAVKIGDVATVTVQQKSGQNVKLHIEADRSVPITRIEAPSTPRGVSWGISGKPEGPSTGAAAK